MHRARVFTCFLLAVFTHSQVSAADRSGWSFGGTVDGNSYLGNGQGSWLSGATGKYRVGSGDNSVLLQAALALNYDLSLQSGFSIEGAYYSDPDHEVGITQAFWHFKPMVKERWRSNYRVGAFHVPISLENPGPLWHSLYTASPSLINTWVGEELRTLGAQGRWSWRPNRTNPNSISLLAAAFVANDTAGAMLAWRGWAAHNRQTLLGETVPIPALPVIAPGQPFERQAPAYEPFVEVDNRIGYYVGADWKRNNKFSLRYLYYNNQGDPLALVDGQYAWDTHFHHVGFKARLADQWTLISQLMVGNTIMGPRAVDNDFMSAHLLLSRKVNRHRFTARIETFEIDDRDFLNTVDPNDESGHRVTLSYSLKLGDEWLATIEVSQLQSDRRYRELFNEVQKIKENQGLFQVRYRF